MLLMLSSNKLHSLVKSSFFIYHYPKKHKYCDIILRLYHPPLTIHLPLKCNLPNIAGDYINIKIQPG